MIQSQALPTPAAGRGLALIAVLLLVLCNACRTVSRLPPANLEAPGWTIRQGQAVWQRQRGEPEIAGDLLLATNTDGRSVVQFSKGGFPLVLAQSTATSWQVELPAQNRRYSGRGLPPKRLLILYLPRALAGQAMPQGWSWKPRSEEGWRLENPGARESLEGYLNRAP